MANHRNRRSSTPLSEGAWFGIPPLGTKTGVRGPWVFDDTAQGLSRCLVPAAAIRPGVGTKSPHRYFRTSSMIFQRRLP